MMRVDTTHDTSYDVYMNNNTFATQLAQLEYADECDALINTLITLTNCTREDASDYVCYVLNECAHSTHCTMSDDQIIIDYSIHVMKVRD